MNSAELEAPNIELREATQKVAKAAERYASGYAGGFIDIKMRERGHIEIMRAVKELRAVRRKWGMDKHTFVSRTV